MKDYKAVALALPTIVALTLGGVALTAAPALAETAPAATAETSPAAPAAEVAGPDATDDGAGAPTAEVPAETAETGSADETAAPTPLPTEAGEAPAAPVVTDAPALPTETEAAPGADEQVEVAAEPAGFSVISPLDGALLPSAGVVLTVDVPAGSTVSADTGPGGGGVYLVSPGSTFSHSFHLPASDVPVEHVVTVQVTGPDGSDLGATQRRVVVPALTALPAPVLTSPATGDTVVGAPYTSGSFSTGAFLLTGTGVAGAVIDVDLLALDPVVAWGYGHDPIVVGADGTWTHGVWTPYGAWRVSVAQQTVDGNGFATSLPSTFSSADVRVVRPDAAPTTPVVPSTAPVVRPAAQVTAAGPLLRAAAAEAPRRGALASTGTDESTPWAGLAGAGLVVLGGVVLVVARRARRA
jgi:LPXTG-motif cell wall-anchored protein